MCVPKPVPAQFQDVSINWTHRKICVPNPFPNMNDAVPVLPPPTKTLQGKGARVRCVTDFFIYHRFSGGDGVGNQLSSLIELIRIED